QVRRELDPLEAPREREGQGLGQGGLPDPRHVLHQDVAAAQERHHQAVDGPGLAEDHLAQLRLQGRDVVEGAGAHGPAAETPRRPATQSSHCPMAFICSTSFVSTSSWSTWARVWRGRWGSAESAKPQVTAVAMAALARASRASTLS